MRPARPVRSALPPRPSVARSLLLPPAHFARPFLAPACFARPFLAPARCARALLALALPALAALAALLALAGCSGGAGDGGGFLSIGTGGTGGVYYPLGGALASRLSLAAPGRRVTAEVTGGSVENVNRLRAGQLDLGFALSVTAFEAHRGEGDFEAAFDSLRIVAPLYPNLTHVLVREAASIQTVGDLRGRRVSVGSPGSGTEQVSRQLLEAYGLGYDDVEERFLSFSESAAALRDGAIDAAVLSVGYPAGAVLEALTAGGIALLPIDASGLARLRERYPYYAAGTIPPGVYPRVGEPVATAAMMNWIVGRSDLDSAVVADLLNILGPERVSLVQSHEMARQIDLATLGDAPIPLHATTAAWSPP